MDRKCRINRKTKMAKVIEKHAKPQEPFSVWDVQCWWGKEDVHKGPSVKEISKLLPAMTIGDNVRVTPKTTKSMPLSYVWNGLMPIYEPEELRRAE